MRLTLLCFVFLPILSVPGFARAVGQSTPIIVPVTPQGAVGSKTAAPDKIASYSAEPVVIEHMDTVYTMAADGTGSREMTMVARVQIVWTRVEK